MALQNVVSKGAEQGSVSHSAKVEIAVIPVILVLGIILLGRGHAATSALSLEAEQGTTVIPAAVVTDATASGGTAVKFGATTMPSGPGYYVNCSTGSDSNNGKSSSTAWKTLSKVSVTTFSAGDDIYLAKGCSFDGGLTLNGTGTAASPITLDAYGSGSAPVVSYSTASLYTAAITVNGTYFIIQNLKMTNAPSAGVAFEGTHNIVRSSEVTATGEGVEFDGQYNLATEMNVHDLKMVVDTPGGNDDYGAIGFDVGANNSEISYSTCTNCKAQSDDYGTDGGFVEVWKHADNLYVHDNLADNDDDFIELGGNAAGDSADNVRLAYNVIYNSGNIINIHTGDVFNIPVANLQYTNNTYYESPGTAASWFYSASTAVTSKNNIFDGGSNNSTAAVHTNNIYTNASGFTLGSGEKQVDPLFVDPTTLNFHLQATSPARGAGATGLGYTTDYDGTAVTSPPDIGAFQYK